MNLATTKAAAAPHKRWLLWLPLLGVGAWLAVFGDKSPSGSEAALSLPTRAAPATPAAPRPRPVGAPANEALEALVPRDTLIPAPATTASGTRASARAERDLFASKNWNPPPPPAPVVVAAPVAPPLPFVFLGKKHEGDVWEVYLARGEQTFIVREGMTLDGTYRVDKIAPPSLALTYIPLGQAQTLSIGETR